MSILYLKLASSIFNQNQNVFLFHVPVDSVAKHKAADRSEHTNIREVFFDYISLYIILFFNDTFLGYNYV